MSEERQHVTPAGYAAYALGCGADGYVFLWVAEHEELLQQRDANRSEVILVLNKSTDMLGALTAERDQLRAEVERLRRDLRNADAALADTDERLREGRDAKGADTYDSAYPIVGGVRSLVLDIFPAALDHRLGLPQPEGEPCEPMSARPPRVWL